MAEVTAALVKKLRDMTGAGMMDCKKALMATDGDMEKADEYLREKGLSAIVKKQDRIAAEGVCRTLVSEDNKSAVLVEVNCETDFVAKNEIFRDFVDEVCVQAIASSNEEDIEAFLDEKWHKDSSLTVRDALSTMISRIGEKLSIRRFKKVVNENGCIVSYIHGGGRIGVLVNANASVVNDGVKTCLTNVGMQVAAMRPLYLRDSEISAEFIQKEKAILTEQAKNENSGKPENIIERMVEGRLKKELREICLEDQEYVFDPEAKINVKQYVERTAKAENAELALVSYLRFEAGEGLEKRADNFAEEVASQMSK